MEPITAFIPICKELGPEEFARKFPYHFLVHSTLTGGSLKPLDQTRGMTVDRLVVPDGSTGPATPAIVECFTVFRLRPRAPDAPTISVGLSSTCDVQVNDASLSKVHAHFSVVGGNAFIRDADSTSGTTVNGDAVSSAEWFPVAAGDRISLGFVEMVLLPPVEFQGFIRTLFGV